MKEEFTNSYLMYFEIACAVVFIAMLILFVIAEWRILKKAGEKGWKSLIPVYSIFVSHHIAGMSHVWFILEIVTWIAELVFEIFKLPGPVVFWFGVAAGIFTLLSELIHILKLCGCFKKGIGFKIGMILFPNLFLLILAFGKSEYEKPSH